jgi:hypothetical protein
MTEMCANLVDLASASKRQLYLQFLYLIVALMLVAGLPQRQWRLWRIAQDPATATGVVTRLDCPNHGHVDFVFRLESASFDGREQSVGGIACRQLFTGQRIAVHYQRAQPANNYARVESEDGGNPVMTEFYTGVLFLGMATLVGPLFLVMLFSLARWLAPPMPPGLIRPPR